MGTGVLVKSRCDLGRNYLVVDICFNFHLNLLMVVGIVEVRFVLIEKEHITEFMGCPSAKLTLSTTATKTKITSNILMIKLISVPTHQFTTKLVHISTMNLC